MPKPSLPQRVPECGHHQNIPISAARTCPKQQSKLLQVQIQPKTPRHLPCALLGRLQLTRCARGTITFRSSVTARLQYLRSTKAVATTSVYFVSPHGRGCPASTFRPDPRPRAASRRKESRGLVSGFITPLHSSPSINIHSCIRALSSFPKNNIPKHRGKKKIIMKPPVMGADDNVL